ncbi:hypothetical protein [Streptomyces sp. NPDC094472]
MLRHDVAAEAPRPEGCSTSYIAVGGLDLATSLMISAWGRRPGA